MSATASHGRRGPAPPTQIVLVGLGVAGERHRKVLEQIPDVVVVAGVDAAPRRDVTFRGGPLPVYGTLQAAAGRHDPGLVVVATPTPSHADVCDEVAERFPAAEVLVEKPAADKLGDMRRLLSPASPASPASGRQPVTVAYHLAFSPEVLWGAELVTARSGELGAPVAIQALFSDPYGVELEAARSRLGTSWLDSGINALSILERFVQPVERQSLRRLGPESWSAFEARLTCRIGGGEVEALILTSWQVTAAGRTTRVRYASGAELVMDHVAVAGYLIERGSVHTAYGSDGSIPRGERHYQALYRSWLVDGQPMFPAETSRRLHELLLAPQH